MLAAKLSMSVGFLRKRLPILMSDIFTFSITGFGEGGGGGGGGWHYCLSQFSYLLPMLVRTYQILLLFYPLLLTAEVSAQSHHLSNVH